MGQATLTTYREVLGRLATMEKRGAWAIMLLERGAGFERACEDMVDPDGPGLLPWMESGRAKLVVALPTAEHAAWTVPDWYYPLPVLVRAWLTNEVIIAEVLGRWGT